MARKSKILLSLICSILVLLAVSSCRRVASDSRAGMDPGDANAAAEAVTRAEGLYEQRGYLAKVRQAVASLRQARTADYGSYEAAWKLSRADYYLGSHSPDDQESENAFREGTAVGKIAVQLENNKPDGHFWLGANYGGSAERSTLAGLAAIEDIRQEMETVLKLDEGYQSGSAYMVLGQLYLQAPKVLGGDTNRAIGYLEKGLRFGQDNSLLRLHLAEAFQAAGRTTEARKQLDELFAMKAASGYVPEHNEALEKGKKLLEKLK